MGKLPRIIERAYEKLREEYPFYVALKKINGKYYIYKETGIWIKDKKKSKVVSEYLGRISEEGRYIKKRLSAKEDLENAKALIEEHGGEITWRKNAGNIAVPSTEKTLTPIDADIKLLTVLSMNARAPVSLLSARSGLGRSAVASRLKRLEKRLGLRYILEVDVDKLGFLTYMVLIKFGEKQPSRTELEEALRSEARIQFAALVKGEYDLILYFLDEDQVKAADHLWELRSRTSLGKYDARWYVTPFGQVYSFMPLGKNFLEHIIKSKEWRKTKENPSIQQNQLTHREFVTLSELSANSTRSFSDIDNLHKLGSGAARYSYSVLRERGIISRVTITIDVPKKYIGIMLLETINATEAHQNLYKLFMDDIEYGEIANKYALIGNTGVPEGSIYFLPVMKDGDLESAKEKLQNAVNGINIKTLIVTDTLIGELCYRRFDNMHSRQYKSLVDLKKIDIPKLAEY